MRYRFLACIFAVCSLAMAQTQRLTVQQLVTFIKNQQEFIKQGHSTDKETANFLGSVRLTEKLEDRVIEDLQALGIGKLTAGALEKLKEQSKGLAAGVIKQELPDDPIPIPTSEEQGRILDDVRRYVMNYDDNLPDFICLEVEHRKVAPQSQSRQPSFRETDTIVSKLTYFQHKENKELIAPIGKTYEELGGSTSTGDFGAVLRGLFDPDTQARFTWARWITLRGRQTMVFKFRVEQSRSRNTIVAKDVKRQIVTAYSGEVCIDDETHAVTRLTTVAEDIPEDFPVRRAERQLDYDYVDIGEQRHLLPYAGIIRLDGAEELTENSLNFQHYKKYEVGSAISYDIPADMSAVPDDKLKEAPPIDCKAAKNKDAAACKTAPPAKKK